MQCKTVAFLEKVKGSQFQISFLMQEAGIVSLPKYLPGHMCFTERVQFLKSMLSPRHLIPCFTHTVGTHEVIF